MKSSLVGAIFLASLSWSAAWGNESTADAFKASDIRGGLVVQVGCGDCKLAEALTANDSFVVQCLDTNPTNIARMREQLRSLGSGGKATAACFDGHTLPYVNELVNLIVAEDLGDIAMSEVMRVLCPGGVACIKQGGQWSKTTKPWPDAIDEWTHYLHDSRGTSVSNDLLAGQPNGLRWTGGPFWARSHEHTASMTAMVSAAGRVFYVMDEGPTDSIQLPAQDFLTARDAFNGTVLWKRPLHDWWNSLYPLKSGPGWLPRRLVAVDDRVYIAPGVGQDVLCLDATTGQTVRRYPGTASTFELIVSDRVLLAAVDPNETSCDYKQEDANCWKERDRASNRWGWHLDQGTRIVKAIQSENGKLLWQREMPVVPMTLAADERMVCLHDGSGLVALDRRTGTELWRTDGPKIEQVPTGYSGPRVVICGDRVLFSPMRQMMAIAADSGKVLWSVKGKPRSGHFSLEDFYVIGDKVWVLGRGNQGAYITYSLETGEKLKEITNPIDSFYIHQRCYPGRATCRVQLPPMMGIMVYDMQEDAWSNNHWVRGGCVYGVMPANGMVYATPHACACYYQSKLNGFNALSPEPQTAEAPDPEERLTKGPAFGTTGKTTESSAADWPVFRHDNTRSGYARTSVPVKLKKAWQKDYGTKLTQPVATGGRVLFSAVDQHTVFAVDAENGNELWHFIAGGRVDSPPTVYGALALFGCADGSIYAVRVSDGALAWKFQAAPTDRELMAYGQLESVWPLNGSVLVQDGKLFAVAGRSMFLDGGLRMVILDPQTGQLVSENVMDRRVPGSEQPLDELLMGKHLPVAMPDILSGDGQYVYMKSQTFTPDGKRVRISPQRPDTQYDKEVHLFSPISFLDDGWHQRTYWIYGRAAGEGWAEFQFPPKRVPCGRIVCLDETSAYAYARDPELLCNTSVSEYRLYRADKYPTRKVGIPKLEGKWVQADYPADDPLAPNSVDWKQLATLPMEKLTALDYDWIHEEPDVMAKAMVLANDRLFVAGPRDVVDEKQMWGFSNDPTFQEKMAEQAAWLQGGRGGVLQVFAKADGEKLAEYELDRLPAFDGLIAADGSLYMVTSDGSILSLQGK